MSVSQTGNHKQQTSRQQTTNYLPYPLTINIEFCINCSYHGPSLRHQQQKYIDCFNKIKFGLSNQILLKQVSVYGNRVPSSLKPIKKIANIAYQQSPRVNAFHLRNKNKYPSHQNYFNLDQQKLIDESQQLKKISEVNTMEKYYDKIYDQTMMFPRIGAFEIYCNNTPIFSKLQNNQWPQTQKIVQSVKQMLNEIHQLREKQGENITKQQVSNILQKFDCNFKQSRNMGQSLNSNDKSRQQGINFRVKNSANSKKQTPPGIPTFFGYNRQNNTAGLLTNPRRNKSMHHDKRASSLLKQGMDKLAPQIQQVEQQNFLSSRMVKDRPSANESFIGSMDQSRSEEYQRNLIKKKIQQIMVNKQKTNGPVRRRHFKKYNNIFLDLLVPKILNQQLTMKLEQTRDIQKGKWEDKRQASFFNLEDLKQGFALLFHQRFDNHKQQILEGRKNFNRIETEKKRRRTLSTKINSQTNSTQRNNKEDLKGVTTRSFKNHLLAQQIAKVDYQNGDLFKRSDEELVSGRKSQKTTRSRLLQKKMHQISEQQKRQVRQKNEETQSIELPRKDNQVEDEKDYEPLLRQEELNYEFQESQTNTIKLIVTNAEREKEEQQLSFCISRTNAENTSNIHQFKIKHKQQDLQNQGIQQNIDQCIGEESHDKNNQAYLVAHKKMSSSVPIDSSQPLRAAAQKDRLQHSQRHQNTQNQKKAQARNVSDMLQVTVSQQHHESLQTSIRQQELGQTSKTLGKFQQNKHQQILYFKIAQSKIAPQQEQRNAKQEQIREEQDVKQAHQYQVSDRQHEEMSDIKQQPNENNQEIFQIKISNKQRNQHEQPKEAHLGYQNSLYSPSDPNIPISHEGEAPLQILQKNHTKDLIPSQNEAQIEFQPMNDESRVQILQIQQENKDIRIRQIQRQAQENINKKINAEARLVQSILDESSVNNTNRNTNQIDEAQNIIQQQDKNCAQSDLQKIEEIKQDHPEEKLQINKNIDE